MSGGLGFFIANGVLDFVASLAAFIAWHHFDFEGRWKAWGIRKAREQAERDGEPATIQDDDGWLSFLPGDPR